MKKQRGLQTDLPALIFGVMGIAILIVLLGKNFHTRYVELTENEKLYYQLLNEKENVNSDISNIENQLLKEKEKSSDLKKEITKKEKEIKSIKKKYKESIQAIEKEKENHDKEIKGLKDELNDVNKKNEWLSKKISDLEKELSKLKSISASEKTNTNKKETDKTNTSSSKKIAYLTFDDGPSNNTSEILDILSEHDIKATFFPIGKNSKSEKELYKRIVDEGHTLGNHTYSHNYKYIYETTDNLKEDLLKLENHLTSITGVSPNVIRFPGGSKNTVSHKYGGEEIMQEIVNMTTDMGYVHFDWNIDSTDATKEKQDKDIIVKTVLDSAKNKTNAIILFHDSSSKTTTVSALEEIIIGLKEQGFSFEKITTETKAVQFTKPQ